MVVVPAHGQKIVCNKTDDITMWFSPHSGVAASTAGGCTQPKDMQKPRKEDVQILHKAEEMRLEIWKSKKWKVSGIILRRKWSGSGH